MVSPCLLVLLEQQAALDACNELANTDLALDMVCMLLPDLCNLTAEHMHVAVNVQGIVSKGAKGSSSTAQKIEEELAEAYWRLGQAFATEADHPDQDSFKAVKVLPYFSSPCCLCACMHVFIYVFFQAWSFMLWPAQTYTVRIPEHVVGPCTLMGKLLLACVYTLE